MQRLLLFKQMIASQGKIAAPAGKAPVSVVDVRDIAAVAVAVAALTEPGHEGKTYDITGPEALTHAQMAEELTRTLGKPVIFEDISGTAMREALLSFHMPEWQAEGLVEDYEHYARSRNHRRAPKKLLCVCSGFRASVRLRTSPPIGRSTT